MMVWHVSLYNALLLLCLVYASGWGGAPERINVMTLTLGSALTAAAYAPLAGRFRDVETQLLIVDILVFFAFLAVSQRANRAWPIMVSGLQLAGIGIHCAKALSGNRHAFGYAFLDALPAYPMLACIAAGTWRHRQRMASYGCDPAWSRRSG